MCKQPSILKFAQFLIAQEEISRANDALDLFCRQAPTRQTLSA
jgi:hypothetical protein